MIGYIKVKTLNFKKKVVNINTELSSTNLIKRSSIIKQTFNSREVKIVTYYHNLASGKVGVLI